jgi:hypothetical protein
MNKLFTLLACIAMTNAYSQPEISKWKMNRNGQTASYWENSNGSPNNPTFVFHTSTALADVTKFCYNDTAVWVKSEGMTVNMGQFLNPGAPSAQNYTFLLPRKPVEANVKTTSPLVGAIGVLTNGIPIYGLSNAHYYNGSNNNGMGVGTWNVEVYLSEGFVLDTAFGAHPQQQGAYHTHAKPYRLFSSTASSVHSPLIGFAFDGYPVYGPYGYSDPNDSTSAITRMKTGFSLRNITSRTSLPYGGTLNASQYGPEVSTTYPIGTYSEDYEWLSTNGGDLDKYNGRFCFTPEYPKGTYAYFVTINASGTPEYPYIIGPQYYGKPQAANLKMKPVINIPSSATCKESTTSIIDITSTALTIPCPNPSKGIFNISLPDFSGASELYIYNNEGQLVYSETFSGNLIHVDMSDKCQSGVFMLKVVNEGVVYTTRMVLE